MKTIILTFLLLGHIWLFGQKTQGVLKFDFDTTVIYADLGVVFEFSGNELYDSVQNLWSRYDTTVTRDLERLVCNGKVYEFDTRKALKKLLKKDYADIYYKGKKIDNYKIERNFKRKKHDYYYYIDTQTNKRFLVLTVFQRHSADGNPAF
jgi:hypothetical protein